MARHFNRACQTLIMLLLGGSVLLAIVFGSILAASADQPMMLATGNKAIGVKIFNASFQQKVVEIPAETNHVWRKTPDGWREIPVKQPPFIHCLDLPHNPPRIHPFSVATLTLLMCLAAMAWASSEWDWERFVGESKQH